MDRQQTTGFSREPLRVQHMFVQSINASPERVFPLLCPVRELEWVSGWQPDWVISNSGVAEEGCIFRTPASPEEHTGAATWIITDHDPDSFRLRMIKLVPDHTVTTLRVSLQADGPDRTRATISYEYTALGAEGARFIADRTPDWYRGFMEGWEAAMNHYLKTGERLSA